MGTTRREVQSSGNLVMAPRVPHGLAAAVEGLTREVIRHRPEDIYDFAAQHFEQLLSLRDQYGAVTNLPGRSGNNVALREMNQSLKKRYGTSDARSRQEEGNEGRGGWSLNVTAKVLERHRSIFGDEGRKVSPEEVRILASEKENASSGKLRSGRRTKSRGDLDVYEACETRHKSSERFVKRSKESEYQLKTDSRHSKIDAKGAPKIMTQIGAISGTGTMLARDIKSELRKNRNSSRDGRGIRQRPDNHSDLEFLVQKHPMRRSHCNESLDKFPETSKYRNVRSERSIDRTVEDIEKYKTEINDSSRSFTRIPRALSMDRVRQSVVKKFRSSESWDELTSINYVDKVQEVIDETAPAIRDKVKELNVAASEIYRSVGRRSRRESQRFTDESTSGSSRSEKSNQTDDPRSRNAMSNLKRSRKSAGKTKSRASAVESRGNDSLEGIETLASEAELRAPNGSNVEQDMVGDQRVPSKDQYTGNRRRARRTKSAMRVGKGGSLSIDSDVSDYVEVPKSGPGSSNLSLPAVRPPSSKNASRSVSRSDSDHLVLPPISPEAPKSAEQKEPLVLPCLSALTNTIPPTDSKPDSAKSPDYEGNGLEDPSLLEDTEVPELKLLDARTEEIFKDSLNATPRVIDEPPRPDSLDPDETVNGLEQFSRSIVDLIEKSGEIGSEKEKLIAEKAGDDNIVSDEPTEIERMKNEMKDIFQTEADREAKTAMEPVSKKGDSVEQKLREIRETEERRERIFEPEVTAVSTEIKAEAQVDGNDTGSMKRQLMEIEETEKRIEQIFVSESRNLVVQEVPVAQGDGGSSMKEKLMELEETEKRIEKIFQACNEESVEEKSVQVVKSKNGNPESTIGSMRQKLIEIEDVEKRIHEAFDPGKKRQSIETVISTSLLEDDRLFSSGVQDDDLPARTPVRVTSSLGDTETVTVSISAASDSILAIETEAKRTNVDERAVHDQHLSTGPSDNDLRFERICPETPDSSKNSYILTEGSPYDIPDTVTTVVIPDSRLESSSSDVIQSGAETLDRDSRASIVSPGMSTITSASRPVSTVSTPDPSVVELIHASRSSVESTVVEHMVDRINEDDTKKLATSQRKVSSEHEEASEEAMEKVEEIIEMRKSNEAGKRDSSGSSFEERESSTYDTETGVKLRSASLRSSSSTVDTENKTEADEDLERNPNTMRMISQSIATVARLQEHIMETPSSDSTGEIKETTISDDDCNTAPESSVTLQFCEDNTEARNSESSDEVKETTITDQVGEDVGKKLYSLVPQCYGSMPHVPELNLDSLQDITVSSFQLSDDATTKRDSETSQKPSENTTSRSEIVEESSAAKDEGDVVEEVIAEEVGTVGNDEDAIQKVIVKNVSTARDKDDVVVEELIVKERVLVREDPCIKVKTYVTEPDSREVTGNSEGSSIELQNDTSSTHPVIDPAMDDKKDADDGEIGLEDTELVVKSDAECSQHALGSNNIEVDSVSLKDFEDLEFRVTDTYHNADMKNGADVSGESKQTATDGLVPNKFEAVVDATALLCEKKNLTVSGTKREIATVDENKQLEQTEASSPVLSTFADVANATALLDANKSIAAAGSEQDVESVDRNEQSNEIQAKSQELSKFEDVLTATAVLDVRKSPIAFGTEQDIAIVDKNKQSKQTGGGSPVVNNLEDVAKATSLLDVTKSIVASRSEQEVASADEKKQSKQTAASSPLLRNFEDVANVTAVLVANKSIATTSSEQESASVDWNKFSNQTEAESQVLSKLEDVVNATALLDANKNIAVSGSEPEVVSVDRSERPTQTEAKGQVLSKFEDVNTTALLKENRSTAASGSDQNVAVSADANKRDVQKFESDVSKGSHDIVNAESNLGAHRSTSLDSQTISVSSDYDASAFTTVENESSSLLLATSKNTTSTATEVPRAIVPTTVDIASAFGDIVTTEAMMPPTNQTNHDLFLSNVPQDTKAIATQKIIDSTTSIVSEVPSELTPTTIIDLSTVHPTAPPYEHLVPMNHTVMSSALHEDLTMRTSDELEDIECHVNSEAPSTSVVMNDEIPLNASVRHQFAVLEKGPDTMIVVTASMDDGESMSSERIQESAGPMKIPIISPRNEGDDAVPVKRQDTLSSVPPETDRVSLGSASDVPHADILPKVTHFDVISVAVPEIHHAATPLDDIGDVIRTGSQVSDGTVLPNPPDKFTTGGIQEIETNGRIIRISPPLAEVVTNDLDDNDNFGERMEYHIYVPDATGSEGSTTESSTFNSAATKIQAGVRGFLTRRRLQSAQRRSSTLDSVPSIQDSFATDVAHLEPIEEVGLAQAATTIQCNYRGYKARQRLRREDAVQKTILSVENAFSENGLQHTGEFHDCLPLPLFENVGANIKSSSSRSEVDSARSDRRTEVNYSRSGEVSSESDEQKRTDNCGNGVRIVEPKPSAEIVAAVALETTRVGENDKTLESDVPTSENRMNIFGGMALVPGQYMGSGDGRNSWEDKLQIVQGLNLIISTTKNSALQDQYLNFITSVEEVHDEPMSLTQSDLQGGQQELSSLLSNLEIDSLSTDNANDPSLSSISTREPLAVPGTPIGVVIEELHKTEEDSITDIMTFSQSCQEDENQLPNEMNEAMLSIVSGTSLSLPGLSLGPDISGEAEHSGNEPELDRGVRASRTKMEAPVDETGGIPDATAKEFHEEPDHVVRVLEDRTGAEEASLETMSFSMNVDDVLGLGAESDFPKMQPISDVIVTPRDLLKLTSMSQASQLSGERVESPVTMMQIVPKSVDEKSERSDDGRTVEPRPDERTDEGVTRGSTEVQRAKSKEDASRSTGSSQSSTGAKSDTREESKEQIDNDEARNSAGQQMGGVDEDPENTRFTRAATLSGDQSPGRTSKTYSLEKLTAAEITARDNDAKKLEVSLEGETELVSVGGEKGDEPVEPGGGSIPHPMAEFYGK